MRSPLREIRRRVEKKLREVVAPVQALANTRPAPMTRAGDEPPVVARLVVEVRSDGTHTVAQGAIEDVATGEQVGIRAEGTTPGQLAASLARSLVSLPLMAAQAARAARFPSRERPAPRPPGEVATAPGASIDTEGSSADLEDEAEAP